MEESQVFGSLAVFAMQILALQYLPQTIHRYASRYQTASVPLSAVRNLL